MEWLFQFDVEGYRAINVESRQSWLDPIMIGFSESGLGHFVIFGILLLIMFKQTRPYVIPLLSAFVVSGLVRLVMFMVIARQRPSNYSWASPLEGTFGNSSFPSGHATTAMAVAFMAIFLTWGTRKAYLGWIVMGWAAIVAYSRIYVGVHYPLDIVGGICLGFICAVIVYLLMDHFEKLPTQRFDRDLDRALDAGMTAKIPPVQESFADSQSRSQSE
ncbi:MAG: phosphatase PAP2 family protein [Fimbriimonadaceae bacterium]